MKLYLQNPKMRFGLAILALMLLASLLAAFVLPLDPMKQDLMSRLKPPGTLSRSGHTFWLGTDQFGRDLLARLIAGAKVPLIIATCSAVIGSVIGLTMGLMAGYFGGKIDWIVGLFTDIQFSLPFILIALFVMSLFGSSIPIIVFTFALLSWPSVARVARVTSLRLTGSLFVEACRASGLSNWRIITRHILPNALPPVIVISAVQVAQFVVAEASLGFFGLGIAPPAPTWGNMLSDGRNYIMQAWWLNVLPGVCIVFLALAANLVGEGLREVLDPRDDEANL